MFNDAKQFIVLLALVMLPTQGVAMALSGIVCSSGGETPVAHVAHAGDDHDHGARSGGSHEDDGAGIHYEHFSCNHLVFVLPTTTLPETTPDFAVWALAAHSLTDLFVPERPQRPPLA